jgi:hypothetical protein
LPARLCFVLADSLRTLANESPPRRLLRSARGGTQGAGLKRG